MKSLELGRWVDEEPYELSEDFPAAQVMKICELQHTNADEARTKWSLISIVSNPTFPLSSFSNSPSQGCLGFVIKLPLNIVDGLS